MKKSIKPILFSIISLKLLLTFGCSNLEDQGPPDNILDYGDIRRYNFDPHTIVPRLDQGSKEVFQSILGGGDAGIKSSDLLGWQPRDYFRVAGALNQVTSQDDLTEWSIYKLSFNGDCNTNPIGFEDAHIVYFKTEGDTYATRDIGIFLWKKEADWAGGAVSPRPFFGWKNVDQKKLKVSADDAFQIAESNGGKAARQAINNLCSFNMVISPNGYFKDWNIQYVGSSSGATLFMITIDPYDGTYKINTPRISITPDM